MNPPLRAGHIAKVLVLIFLILLGASIIAYFVVFRPMESITTCSEEGANNSISPDGSIVASVLVRNCGATVDFVTHVNLRDARAPADQGANGALKSGEVWKAKGEIPVTIQWNGSDNLVISLHSTGALRMESSVSNWKNVSISVKHSNAN
jgi:hypothetical protein